MKPSHDVKTVSAVDIDACTDTNEKRICQALAQLGYIRIIKKTELSHEK